MTTKEEITAARSTPPPLFDLPAAGEFQCPRCLEVSPTRYMHELNHHPMGNSTMCTSQYLTMMQERSSRHE